MSKPKYAKIIICCVILTIGVWHGWTQAEPAQPKSKQSSTLDVGRDNPFAEIPKNKKAIPQKVYRSSESDEESPELFVEIVVLKSLDAKSLRTAIASMCSEYGSISADGKGNSLIVCDTKENLARIMQEVERADRTPQQSLFVETVTLKFLEAENLEKALDRMLSQYGSIATNQENNSLIICDTNEYLANILAQIKKADKTPQQIKVEVVILDVQLDDDTEIGINWDILSDKFYDIAYRQNFTTSRLGSTIEDTDTIANATAFNTTGLGGDFTVISGTIRNVVHLLQQKREVETQILSSKIPN